MRKFFYIIMIIIMLLGNCVRAEEFESIFVKATVIEIKDVSYMNNNESKNQIVRVKVLEGTYKDQEIDIEYFTIEYSQSNFDLRKGNKVIIRIIEDGKNEIKASIVDISREEHLKVLGIAFLLTVTIFGRIRGLLSVMSLGVSGLIILKFMIPMIIKGYNPVIIAMLCSASIILTSFILISGFTKKSLTAILGTIGGTVAATILAQVFTKLCFITGLAEEEITFLIREVGMEIDFRGLFLSGVLIGSIGVVMDVAMSITSVIFELKKQSPKIEYMKLINSGLEVGKDIMATMVNTLILAYVGGSMPLFLLFHNLNMPMSHMISKEIIATEIIRSLCGSIGLILTIPLTSIIASTMAKNR